ncbi:MAG: OmpA family protein [Myxococcota bacterium]
MSLWPSTADAARPDSPPDQAAPVAMTRKGCGELDFGEAIEFAPNSTRIRRRSKAMLRTIAALLEEETSPVLLLSIEGYQAPDERRENLALERALVVKDALLELGAHPARLVPLGYDHELWPRRDATWSERRVEFDVLLGAHCPDT